MTQCTKKDTIKKRKAYNTCVINALIEVYGLSDSFIRQSVNKEKDSITAQTIRKQYIKLATPTDKAIEKFRKEMMKNLKEEG